MLIDQKKFEAKGFRICELINNNYITNDDINLLLSKSFEEIIKYSRSPIEKDRLLYKIYIQPYLLCQDKSEKIDINLIVKLMIKRYAMEIAEINYMYKEGTLSLDDYYKYIDSLLSAYFNTSEIGRVIYQNYGGNFELSELFQTDIQKVKNKH